MTPLPSAYQNSGHAARAGNERGVSVCPISLIGPIGPMGHNKRLTEDAIGWSTGKITRTRSSADATMADPSFAQLMARLQARDEAAAAEVFGRFGQRLIGLARQHLDMRVRQKVDPDDVMQSALKSFFLRHA